MDAQVRSLASSGNELFAGGTFIMAGGVVVNNLAKWDGNIWSALGSGVNNTVHGLAVAGSDLYVGGVFTKAGGKLSPYLARAYLRPLPPLSVSAHGPEVLVSWPSAGTVGFTLEQTDTPANPLGWLPSSAALNDDGTNKWVSLPATSPAQSFRLRRP